MDAADFPDHGATLTIDLRALADNWRIVRSRAQEKNAAAECGAVVKANAYGCGIEQVVPALGAGGLQNIFCGASVGSGQTAHSQQKRAGLRVERNAARKC